MSLEAPPRTSLAMESTLFAGRLFTRWRRSPIVPIQALLFPTFLLITYHLLVGQSMTRITGTNNLDGLVPMCAVAGAMFGALGAGLTLPAERASGLLSRFWTLPVHRASPLTGRLLAEAVRTFAGAILITAVGFGLGFRFHGSWLAVIPFLLVPVLVVIVFATVVVTVGLRSGGNTLFTWLATGAIGLVFCNSGVAPLKMFPEWIRPLIQFQPMSPTIESMRALASGGSALTPLLLTCAWLVGLAAIFGPLAIHGYRVAAEAGT
ncbi:ABC transporter permease [Mycobacterium sp. URHB0044]|uniref:ABC transporter permease n=1 Tax=Mycobacterium sp. URHB0044 TaxID=1380386 RepID=UPI00048AD19C|nr:ABC transporter permease [Mycobacterium sp. URHB0044]